MKRFLLISLLAALSLPPQTVRGEGVDISGSLEMQARTFWQDPEWSGQDGRLLQGALTSTTEVRWRGERTRTSLISILRWDPTDAERNLADLKEAYWAYEGDDFELLVGANTVFWGVTESRHLVDIINQTDLAGDISADDKLGQPMVSLTLQRDWGELTAFVMPYFRERTFPGINGRLRPPLPIDTGKPVYESREEDKHVDVALRYSHYIGDVDIGISAFSGTSREPRFVPTPDGATLLPVYDLIDQFGIDLQYTRNSWLWKFEAIARDGATHTFAAAVGGFEYTMYQVTESGADLGVLFEYLYDGRNEVEPPTIADNDVFVGTRLAFNDVQDTSVLAGVSYDVETGETYASVEAERRFGDDWLAKLRLRTFSGAAQGDTTHWLQRDDYAQVSVSRYF